MSSAPRLEIDLSSGVPPYEQIRGQVAGHVAAGTLREGDRLPTVRALAADLGVAAGTVARAYRELEAEGLVEGRRRAGTVVTGSRPTITPDVTRAAEALVRVADRDGLGETALLELVAGLLRAARA